jgi:DNA polymerase elongation subunit (family B)
MRRVSRIVIDIETAGKEFPSLDGAFRDFLLRRAGTEEERKQVKETLGLHPLTGEIVTISLLNPDTGKGAAYFQAPGELPMTFDEDGIAYEAGTEPEILGKFWDSVRRYDSVVTFNGRWFDCPFIIIRSAVHRIKPTKDLMPNRYSDAHIDLFDRLTFFGAAQRRFGLDLWCRALGIKSPKEEVSGEDVGELFRAGRHLDIARYCVRDVRATAELLKLWETYIKGN